MKKALKATVRYVVLIFYAICALFPIANAVMCSFKSNADIYRANLLPSSPNIENFIKVLHNETFYVGLLNSIIIVAAALVIAILLTSIASYGISRRKEKRFNFIYIFFLSAMMIPVAANMTALYSLIKSLGLLDSRSGLILINVSGAIPMGIMLYTGFIKSIPRELDEAAIVDGCGYIKRFYLVIFPLLKPIIVTQIITSSVGLWNDFFTPLLLISTPSKKPLTFAVYSFIGEHATDWGAVFAMLTLAMIPPIVLFLCAQKHFYGGIAAGAVKG